MKWLLGVVVVGLGVAAFGMSASDSDRNTVKCDRIEAREIVLHGKCGDITISTDAGGNVGIWIASKRGTSSPQIAILADGRAAYCGAWGALTPDKTGHMPNDGGCLMAVGVDQAGPFTKPATK